MTRILDRYVGYQVLMAASFAILIILIILILGNVFKDILRELADRPDLSLVFVARFVGLIVPFALGYAIPFSFLTAILLAFGKLSADSELVSMRMAGLSMFRICLPVAIIAIFFTAICTWINLSVTPWSKAQLEGMKDTFINKAKRDPMFIMKDKQVMNDFSGFLIFADKDEGVLKNFLMVKNAGPQAELIASADVAKLRVDFDTNDLIVELESSNLLTVNGKEKSQPGFFATGETGFSLDRFTTSDQKLQPENLPFFALLHLVTEGPQNSPVFLNDTVLTDDRIALLPEIKAKLMTELSMRGAFSFSCLTFALIGVPLGVTAQRRETTAGFIIALVIFVCYYLLLNLARGQSENPEMKPHLLVWIPNILCLILGLVLFIRVSRK